MKTMTDEEIVRLKKTVAETQEAIRISLFRAVVLRGAVETQEAARLSVLKKAAERLLANVVEPRPE